MAKRDSVVVNGVTLTREQVETAMRELETPPVEQYVTFPPELVVRDHMFKEQVMETSGYRPGPTAPEYSGLYLVDNHNRRRVVWKIIPHPEWPTTHQMLVGEYQE